jgi:NitT/TauT family transport system substrate-binding protein
MIAERPDVVRRFVGATLKAYDELRSHPEQMAKVYAKAVPEYRGRELTLQRVYYYYSKFAWTGQRVAGRIDPDRLNALQISYYDQKIIPRKSPLTDLFTDDFVNDALPIGRKP